MPPGRDQSRLRETLHFAFMPMAFSLAAYREMGDVWQLQLLSRREPFVVTTHPDHVKSLLKAKPEDAPSLTGESPLRPDSRTELGPDLGRCAPHAPAQAAAAAVPRRGRAAVRRHDRRGRQPRDRPLARRRALRAGATDAGGHARRDHGRRVRDRVLAAARVGRAKDARHDPAAAARLDQPHLPADRATERRAGRAPGRPQGAARDRRPPDLRRDPGAAAPPVRPTDATTFSRCCSKPATRTASPSPITSFATS